MTTEEISLLKSSIQKIRPVAEQAAALFYARLFELDPTLRELFEGDMITQSRRLWHASSHVKQSHYDSIGEALLWTLSKGLGADFTFETRAAWGKIYWLLAETIKAGARDGAASLNRAAA